MIKEGVGDGRGNLTRRNEIGRGAGGELISLIRSGRRGSGRSREGEELGVGGCAGVFGGGGLLCRCVSLEHARGTIGVLIWQIERCLQGWVWVREWHMGSHPWNEKNKLNSFSLRIAPHPPLSTPHSFPWLNLCLAYNPGCNFMRERGLLR